MAQNKTEKSKYTSPSTGDFCTAAQYLAEILLTRQAKKEGKVLPFKFWNLEPWKKQFILMIVRINKLFAKYRPECVISAFNHPRAQNAFSVSFPGIIKIIEEEEHKKDNLFVNEDILTGEIKENIPQTFGKKSNLGKLRDL